MKEVREKITEILKSDLQRFDLDVSKISEDLHEAWENFPETEDNPYYEGDKPEYSTEKFIEDYVKYTDLEMLGFTDEYLIKKFG